MAREAVEALLSRIPRAASSRLLEGASPHAILAAFYAARLCRLEGCSEETAAAAALAYKKGAEEVLKAGLPQHIAHHVRGAVEEAEEAYLRSPSSQYAMIILDADALAHIGAFTLFNISTGYAASLEALLQAALESLSYAVASDYILYTRAAKRLASSMKPHTLAYFNWVAEELTSLGMKARVRIESTIGGTVAYLDLETCPCGGETVKDKVVKPLANCTKYIIGFSCSGCGFSARAETCIPETTRAR